MTTDLVVDAAGERLVLMAERAAFWERTSTLLVADPHFGKAAAFRAAGVPMPRGTTEETLRRLDVAMARVRPARVLFLGDFLHAREGRSPETLRVWHEWRVAHSSTRMTLIRGNHDRRAGDPPVELDIHCVDGPVHEPPFVFAHHPIASALGYMVAGHIHPGARLRGAGRQSVRLPCFWFGERVAVLPAFGELTGLADIEVGDGDRVWVVVEESVIEVRALTHEG